MTQPLSAVSTTREPDDEIYRREGARADPGHARQSDAVRIGPALEHRPRVVIADHRPASRLGIRLALERAGHRVEAECATAGEAAALAAAVRPDACLVDADIPGGGIVAVRAISTRAPGTAVVMLSAAIDEEDVVAAIVAGASGCVRRTIVPERLPVVVRGVLAGEAAIPRALGRRVLEEIRRGGSGAGPLGARERRTGLTAREAQVTQLVQGGTSTRDIAALLGISEVTVRRHVSAALRKLQVPDRQTAVRLSQRSPATNGRGYVR